MILGVPPCRTWFLDMFNVLIFPVEFHDIYVPSMFPKCPKVFPEHECFIKTLLRSWPTSFLIPVAYFFKRGWHKGHDFNMIWEDGPNNTKVLRKCFGVNFWTSSGDLLNPMFLVAWGRNKGYPKIVVALQNDHTQRIRLYVRRIRDYIYKSYSDLGGDEIETINPTPGICKEESAFWGIFVQYPVNYDKTYMQRIHITRGLPCLPQRLGSVWGGSKLYMF